MISPLPETQFQPTDEAPLKILVVEDDPDISEFLTDRLAQQGFNVLHVDNGEDALQTAGRHRPHLVLLDMRLPGIDGLTVCQLLEEDPATSSIPVIFLSGMEAPNIIRRSRAAGGQFFLRKPYDPDVLLLLIEHALDSVW